MTKKDPYEEGHLFSGYTDPSQQDWPTKSPKDPIEVIMTKLEELQEKVPEHGLFCHMTRCACRYEVDCPKCSCLKNKE